MKGTTLCVALRTPNRNVELTIKNNSLPFTYRTSVNTLDSKKTTPFSYWSVLSLHLPHDPLSLAIKTVSTFLCHN